MWTSTDEGIQSTGNPHVIEMYSSIKLRRSFVCLRVLYTTTTLSNVDVAINTLKRQVLMPRDTNRNKSSKRRKLRGSREGIALAIRFDCTCIPHTRATYVDHPLKGKRFANQDNKINVVVESNNYSRHRCLSLQGYRALQCQPILRLSSPLRCVVRLRDVSIALPMS